MQVLTGKDRGLRGKVLVAFPKDDQVLVEGANRVKKHTKQGQSARGSQTGGIVETEAPHPRQQRRLRPPEDRQAGTAGLPDRRRGQEGAGLPQRR